MHACNYALRLSGAIALVGARCVAAARAGSRRLRRRRARRQRPPSRADRRLAPRGKVVTLDRIVAVVNDEVITQYEMDDQKRLVIAQLKRQGTELPPTTCSRSSCSSG